MAAVDLQLPLRRQPCALVSSSGSHNGGVASPDVLGCCLTSFQFSAPFIGPLRAADFKQSMHELQLEEAFPDLNTRCHLCCLCRHCCIC